MRDSTCSVSNPLGSQSADMMPRTVLFSAEVEDFRWLYVNINLDA